MSGLLVLVIFVLVVAVVALSVLCIFLKQKIGVQIKTVNDLQNNMQRHVRQQFDQWRLRECDNIRREQREIAMREAGTQLEDWKTQNESFIRSDAIQKSQSVIIGKVTEHLVPYMSEFTFNPKDVRFIGSPIDLIVFNGMDSDDIQDIIFVEVKTGDSASLSRRQRQIRNTIQAGRVAWTELRIARAD
jgi:predicted Holliday junction resolvase-like endonuclease